MAAQRMKIEHVKLADLTPATWNPRTITTAQMEALKASLTRYSVVEPLVINADGTILGGHQRYAAALQLGWTTMPAVRVDLDEKDAHALNVALNRISGDWDDGRLAAILEEIQHDADLVAVSGFDDRELSQFLDRVNADGPSEFPSPDETTDHRCPSCSYEWTGPCR